MVTFLLIHSMMFYSMNINGWEAMLFIGVNAAVRYATKITVLLLFIPLSVYSGKYVDNFTLLVLVACNAVFSLSHVMFAFFLFSVSEFPMNLGLDIQELPSTLSM